MSVDNQNEIDDISLQCLYAWIDSIPLSRRKKSLTRDFGDGVLVAEIVKYYFPSLVELHNYPPVNSVNQKLINWETLNRRVLFKISYTISRSIMKQIVESSPDVVQTFLFGLMKKIEFQLIKLGMDNSSFNIKPIIVDSFQQKSNRANSFVDKRNDHNSTVHNETSKAAISKSVDFSVNSSGTFKSSFSKNVDFAPVSSNLQANFLVRNPVPLSKLNLMSLDSDTRTLLEEKDQAWNFLLEAVKNLQIKVKQLEHLLHLKDLRLQDMQFRLAKQRSVAPNHSAPHFSSFSNLYF